MSSVNSAVSGVTDLLQSITSRAPSDLSAALSTTTVQLALQAARPSDLVQLSEQALALQQVAGLFAGSGATTGETTDPGTLLLQALASAAATNQSVGNQTAGNSATAATTTTAATETPAEQEASDLFGSGNSTISLLG